MISRLLAVVLLCAAAGFAGAAVLPDALFDASGASAFRAGQKEFLLSLDGGRYAIRDGRVLDARTKSALTNKQVEELLSPAPSAVGATRAPAGTQVKATALVTAAGKAPPNFDGSRARAGAVDATPWGGTGGLGTAALNDPVLLKSRLIARLVFPGTPQEKAALDAAVDDILKTEIGRALAARFVDVNAVSDVVFQDVAASTLTVKDGKRRVDGMGGFTEAQKSPPRVVLNRLYLSADAPDGAAALSGSLAHELFGHSLMTQRARQLGLPFALNYYYRGDEVGAELIDWLMQTELRGEVVDDDPADYLGDPEGYYRRLWTTNDYYVLILSPAEMKDPVGSLRARRPVVAAAKAKLAANLRNMRSWRPTIEHFVGAHGMKRASFAPAEDEIASYEAYAANRAKRLETVSKSLEDQLRSWTRTPSGQKEVRALKASADSSFLRAADAELKARREALLRARAKAATGRKPAAADTVKTAPADAAAPAEPGFDLDALSKLADEDRAANPSHYGK